MSSEAIVAFGIAAIAALFLVHRWSTIWAAQFRDAGEIPTRPSFAEFVAATPNLDDKVKTSDASDVLVDRVSKLYDELNDATKTQEAKATTILGFVGGGASLYALVTQAQSGSHVGVTVMLGLAALFFLSSLLACLLCLVGRRRPGLPRIRTQLAAANVLDAPTTTKARISAYLLLLLLDRTEGYRRVNIVKSYFMELAQQLFAFGVLAIVVNYFLAGFAQPAPKGPTTVHCATPKAKLVNATSLDCTITEDTHGS